MTNLSEHPSPSAEQWQSLKADHIVYEGVLWSVWVAVIPFPLVDALFIGAVLLKMISRLAVEYRVPFSRVKARALVIALLAGSGNGLWTRAMLSGSGLKLLSGPLAALGMLTVAGATTYAVGQVFKHHFAQGGDLDNFHPGEQAEAFNQALEQGKRVANQAKSSKNAPPEQEP